MIAGVCGGIAEYLDIDPTLVRLAFVALVFLGGFSIILYIAAAILMPIASLTVPEPKPATPLPLVSQWLALFFGIVLVLIGLSWLGALAVGFALPDIWNSLRLLFRVSWPLLLVLVGAAIVVIAASSRRR